MRTLAALVAAAGLSIAAPSAARAQPVSAPSGPDTYLQLRGGAFVPQHDDLDRFSTGFDFGVLFGVRFDRHLGVEGGVGYHRTTFDETTAPGMRVQRALSVVPLTASLRARHAFKFAELSVLGGVGLHFAKLGSDTTILGPPDVTDSSSASSQVFGLHVGAGAAFNVWPTTLVGVEVVRSFVPARFDSVDTRIDGLRADVTLTYRL